MAECIFRHILQDIIFLLNGEMYNFVCRLILSQNFLYTAHGFPGIIPFPVQLPSKLLEMNLYLHIVFIREFQMIRTHIICHLKSTFHGNLRPIYFESSFQDRDRSGRAVHNSWFKGTF